MQSTSLSFVLLICCVHIILATRLPMEIVEVTSTQVTSDEKKIGRHKSVGSYGIEQRKGRQIAEVHTPRVLYQVGVSVYGFFFCLFHVHSIFLETFTLSFF